MTNKISQIFVSYSHDDKEWIEALFQGPIRTTRSNSFASIDLNSLVPGENFDKKLKKEIKASSGFVFLVSESFLRSKYISKKEWKWIRKTKAAERICCIEIDNAFSKARETGENQLLDCLVRLHRDQASRLPAKIPLVDHELQQLVKNVHNSISRMLDPEGFDITGRLKKRNLHSIEFLTEGSLAMVYTAKTPTFDKKLAVKVQQEGMSDEFEDGIRGAESISTIPNFVGIYEIDKENKPYYCITEYVEGQTLGALLDEKQREGRRIPVKVAHYILLKLCLALKSVHDRNLAHLNIRPKNIIIDSNNEPFLLPTGRARKVFENRQHPSITNNTSIDTQIFALPEYIRCEEWDNESADIYSLGVIGYWMLAGQPPKVIVNHDELLTDSQAEAIIVPAEDLNTLRLECPVALSLTVMRMIDSNPRQRFQTFDDTLTALMHFSNITLSTVELSWQRCQNSKEHVFEQFYLRFFSEAGDEVKSHFEEKPWPTEKQKNLLGDAIISLFRYYELANSYREIPVTLNPLEGIALQHAQRRIRPAHFYLFAKALIDTVTDIDDQCDDSWTTADEVRRCWQTVVEPGTQYLAQRVGEILRNKPDSTTESIELALEEAE